uniref:DHHA1 domain-containing protein n=1 Tax=Kalanchoe fedtschenkoi TaxID=63787 RepID=A0A7N0ZZH5_KALFE
MATPIYANGVRRAAILYHYPCPDGAFAALAAHLYFSATSTPAVFFPNTVYAPLRTVDLPLHQFDDVYLLDFVGPAGFVQEIASKVSRVIILDHHKTALKTLNGVDCHTGTNAVIADSIPELRSELGHQLATKSRNLNMRGIGAVVYKVPELENDEIVKISLRSIENEDTTPISQNFGGGGHRNASSFMSTVADFERWKVATVSS